MKHALVIGGTGMLSNACLWLANNYNHLSIIARNETKMKKLINKASNPDLITPILLDYTNEIELKEQIDLLIKEKGEIDIVVAWIHSYAKDALSHVIEIISKNNKHNWRLIHVLGSSNLKRIPDKLCLPSNCIYQQVKLGFIIENNYSRWLTNEEISNGVIKAIKIPNTTQVVGVIKPYDKRP